MTMDIFEVAQKNSQQAVASKSNSDVQSANVTIIDIFQLSEVEKKNIPNKPWKGSAGAQNLSSQGVDLFNSRDIN